ncbi:low specificity L-threonine aldolase [Cognatishimia sp. F0-27]|uniref:threonine aldolase family protein n=1 Tax=Cognatishimia sp. F0-27 TaxID=2816855 RepID=UPI001D0C510A|nr:beta-eliminating lyase-related protein [Cognatishimia sp. F0-27]MCC1491421.1 low specificity L-threonine aldolase [Cognatishimia sp. F0-27]
MNFASDNGGPVPQAVLDAMARANEGYAMAYGSDPLSGAVADRIRTLFEAPDAAVYLVATGTAANSLALATLGQPWQTVFCSRLAHIHEDECNAPEFYSGGAKLTLVGDGDRMTPEALRAAIAGEETRGVHGPQRGPVSITNVTERGNVYSLDEMRALIAVAQEYDLPVHLDGARFANACVALGATPAEMSWKIGVDVAVFGGTKNGLMGVEAVVIFDPARHGAGTADWEFELRRKRAAHLFSKHRYLAAQMDAYLTDDLWRDLATRANASGARLRAGLEAQGVTIENDTTANMLFVSMPRGVHKAVQAKGAIYHCWGDLENGPDDEAVTGRLVCDWSMREDAIDRFVTTVAEAMAEA